MVNCSKCGKENDEDAKYCNNCGNSLTDTGEKDNSFEKQVEGFASSVERVGKETEKRIEHASKRLEKAVERAENRLENWQDRTFGIFGPLISSFIGLIVLRLVIEGLRIGAEDTPVLAEVSNILYNYLLLLFILMLLSSYTSYFSKRWKSFQWFSPLTFAICFVIIFQLLMKIVQTVSSSPDLSELQTAATKWSEISNLIMIFVVILLFGYLILIAKLAFEKGQRK